METNTEETALIPDVSTVPQKQLHRWLELDTRRRALTKEIKTIREQQKLLEPDIVTFMENNGVSNINFQNRARLRLSTTNKRGQVKADDLEAILQVHLTPEKMQTILALIEEARPTRTETTLKQAATKNS